MRRIYCGGGRWCNVSARLELAVMLAPLSRAIESSRLLQFKPLLPMISRQVNQQAYAMVSHMKQMQATYAYCRLLHCSATFPPKV